MATSAGSSSEVSSSDSKSINSFRRLIEEHQQKLEAYRKDPDAFDNPGILRGKSQEIRERIINGRIRHLETKIRGFQEQLNKLTGRCK
ncbi:MAG: hypothetical protein ABIQ18_26670 [Umezawaea sp.]